MGGMREVGFGLFTGSIPESSLYIKGILSIYKGTIRGNPRQGTL